MKTSSVGSVLVVQGFHRDGHRIFTHTVRGPRMPWNVIWDCMDVTTDAGTLVVHVEGEDVDSPALTSLRELAVYCQQYVSTEDTDSHEVHT